MQCELNDPEGELILAWIDLFKAIVIADRFDFAKVKEIAVPCLVELCKLTNPINRRMVGFTLFSWLGKEYGEAGMKEEPSILRHVMNAFTDTNWKIRSIAAKYMHSIVSNVSTKMIQSEFYPEMRELLADEEMFVRLDAIESFIELKFRDAS